MPSRPGDQLQALSFVFPAATTVVTPADTRPIKECQALLYLQQLGPSAKPAQIRYVKDFIADLPLHPHREFSRRSSLHEQVRQRGEISMLIRSRTSLA